MLVVLVLVIAGSMIAWNVFIQKPKQEAQEKARLEQLAKEKAAQEKAVQDKAKYESLIQSADSAFQQENWEAANAGYSEAVSLMPKETYPKTQLTLVKAKLDEMAARNANIQAGMIETVDSATGRYYVVVSSSVDGDLAQDYATKLAQGGTNAKIIGPDATNKLFHRVTVGNYPTFKEALTASESFRGENKGVWVLKY